MGNKHHIVFVNVINITRPVYYVKHKQVLQQLSLHLAILCVFLDSPHRANTIWQGFLKPK